jgi:SAM-dependent methyltransferase
MTSSGALKRAGGRAEREQRRRIAFFFDDYLDPESRILELGPAAGALEPYLREAGLNRYVRLDTAPPADAVGDVRAWRELGLEAASFDLVIAFDLPQLVDCLGACHELLKPGGYLFVVAPIPGRERLARALAALGLRRAPAASPARPVDPWKLGGFRLVASRRVGGVEQWWRLRKPLDPPR